MRPLDEKAASEIAPPPSGCLGDLDQPARGARRAVRRRPDHPPGETDRRNLRRPARPPRPDQACALDWRSISPSPAAWRLATACCSNWSATGSLRAFRRGWAKACSTACLTARVGLSALAVCRPAPFSVDKAPGVSEVAPFLFRAARGSDVRSPVQGRGISSAKMQPEADPFDPWYMCSDKERPMIAEISSHREELGQLCRQFHVRRLDLFGSAAGDDFDPARSDLDFLVEFDQWALALCRSARSLALRNCSRRFSAVALTSSSLALFAIRTSKRPSSALASRVFEA